MAYGLTQEYCAVLMALNAFAHSDPPSACLQMHQKSKTYQSDAHAFKVPTNCGRVRAW